MNYKVKLVMLVGLLALNTSFAAKVPYGMSGCGLGSFFKSNDKNSQLASAAINMFVFPAWPAMTTGTSGCTENMSKVSAVEKEVYISANYGTIAKEAAQGSGEHLNTLAELMGCEKSTQEAFAKFSQKNYEKLYGTEEASGLINRYQTEMTADQWEGSCKHIG
jgi:hypothetical protein